MPRLPEDIRTLADKSYELLKRDPYHPSLHFKKLGRSGQFVSACTTHCVIALAVALAACAARTTDIGRQAARTIVLEQLEAEGRDASQYNTRVEETAAFGRRCYEVAVWPKVYDNPGWETFIVDPANGRVLGHSYVD